MRTSFLGSTVCVSALACAAEPPLNHERQILALEETWVSALETENRAALDRVVAPDFTFIDPDGALLNRTGVGWAL
jgi:hypothetical protein